jgi:hypothetical protein
MKDRLDTVSAQQLILEPLKARLWLVAGMICQGLIIFAAPPKSGKSWLAIQLALAVACGEPFLDHATELAGVLYLALEDSFSRIQGRLFRLTDEAPNRLRFAVFAPTLNGGLIEQLESYIDEFPDTRLVIIDTLQTVRSSSNDNVYAADYEDLGAIKRFADEHELAVLLVHHTRKMPDAGNVFNTVSGSNGIMGAADETMVLARTNLFDGSATLSIIGRDVELAEYKLSFRDCQWHFVDQTSQEELEERDVPACVISVLDFMAGRAGAWEGTSTQLIAEANLTDIKPNVLTKYMNEHSAFMCERGIQYDSRRSSNARLITLTHVDIKKPQEE